MITDEILEHHYHAFQEPWGEGEKVILQKEDIMQYSKEESKAIWNQNAEFWDCAMGDESNDFHREVVRPKVTELLNPDSTDYILDIACGNGNYSAFLAYTERLAESFSAAAFEEIVSAKAYKKSTIAFLREILNYYKVKNNLNGHLSTLSEYKYPKMEELHEAARIYN